MRHKILLLLTIFQVTFVLLNPLTRLLKVFYEKKCHSISKINIIYKNEKEFKKVWVSWNAHWNENLKYVKEAEVLGVRGVGALDVPVRSPVSFIPVEALTERTVALLRRGQRVMAVVVIRGYHTISYKATCLLTWSPPWDLEAKVYAPMYQWSIDIGLLGDDLPLREVQE